MRCPDRNTLVASLAEQGVESRPLWKPIPELPIYLDAEEIGGSVTRRVSSTGLSLPSSTTLTYDQQVIVIDALASAGHGLTAGKAFVS